MQSKSCRRAIEAIAPGPMSSASPKPQDGSTGFTGSGGRECLHRSRTERIYSKHQQPLINYFAVFAETTGECPTAVKDKPVLSMLKSDA